MSGFQRVNFDFARPQPKHCPTTQIASGYEAHRGPMRRITAQRFRNLIFHTRALCHPGAPPNFYGEPSAALSSGEISNRPLGAC